MAECKYKKRVQFYLDGWSEGSAFKDLDEHLKNCPECQAEMAELVEVSNAAQEILDQAPDRSYWDSFTSRVRNRIISRDVEPVAVETKSSNYPFYGLASVLVIMVLFIGAAVIFMLHPTENTQPVFNMPPPIAGHPALPGLYPMPPPAMMEFQPTRPPSRDMAQATLARPVHEFGKDVSKGASRNSINNSYAELKQRNPASYFKSSYLKGETEFHPSNENALAEPISLTDNSNFSDPSFRLKSAFIGQRILTGLGMNTQNSSSLTYLNAPYGNNATSLAGDQAGTSSSWGYLRNPSDTSKSSEINKYYIELELMQTK